MKKIYDAPVLELLAYCSIDPIGATTDESFEDTNDSLPWNNGELGWT